jgi:transglutaminase 1
VTNVETFLQVIFIKNKSSEKSHTVNGNLLVESVLYTGKNRKDLKSMKFSEVVEPNSEKKVTMEVTFVEYFRKLLDQSAFNIACM